MWGGGGREDLSYQLQELRDSGAFNAKLVVSGGSSVRVRGDQCRETSLP